MTMCLNALNTVTINNRSHDSRNFYIYTFAQATCVISSNLIHLLNSQNVLNNKPGKTKVIELKTINQELEKEIESLKKDSEKSISQEELEQKLNSERLKVGELQVELTNIKSKAGNIEPNKKLLTDIKQLKNANKQLIDQLESSGISNEVDENTLLDENHLSSSLLSSIIIFVICIIGGILILDYINRRRHGGFRV